MATMVAIKDDDSQKRAKLPEAYNVPRIYPKQRSAKTEAIIESRQSSMKINLESRKVESLPANLSNKFAISKLFRFIFEIPNYQSFTTYYRVTIVF